MIIFSSPNIPKKIEGYLIKQDKSVCIKNFEEA